jgi:pimeloyl-ACP methyl ester carboxylesterase
MPKLTRPDGVELHFEVRGEGPPVVFAFGAFSAPQAFEPLIAELAPDHTVVTFDPRGTGRSTRTGPYDIETDTNDLEAVVQEVAAGAVAVCTANATHPAVRVAARRPDLVTAVVATGGQPLGVSATEGAEGLAASRSVREAFVEMVRNDYRGALRTLMADLNTQLDEDGVRERVGLQYEYVSQEAALGRLEAWIADDSGEEGRQLGDRLWLLIWIDNPWFTDDMLDRAGELLPEAHMERVEDGPISRPDIAAGVVRSLTRVRT